MVRFERPAWKPKCSPLGMFEYLLRRPAPVSAHSHASGMYRVSTLELLSFRASLDSMSRLTAAQAFMKGGAVGTMTAKGSLPVSANKHALGVDKGSFQVVPTLC